MRRQNRTKKVCDIDRQVKFSEMAERKPRAAAARHMIHKAYSSYSTDANVQGGERRQWTKGY